jgi:acyl dehydratase
MSVIALSSLPEAVGRDLGTSEPMLIDQTRIDRFADATNDHQWIHVDVDRAATGPYNGTIAHGYLTLSTTGAAVADLLQVPDATSILNYGINKVRFPSVVPSGSTIRVHGALSEVGPVSGGFQVTIALTARVDGQERPACVAEAIVRFLR